jgi:alpha-mannosidase
VKYILDTVVEELLKNPARKFVYVEQHFFQTWWVRQNAAVQASVKTLVANGQLEFLNGGWCMHDEAATHYLDMIDQTTLGHQFILQEFGVTPKVGWQIDPFGHSATQAALLSGVVGFEALFFGRIDHQDHDLRMVEKNMEFIWRPSPSLGTSGQVFTGAFQNGNYGPPNGFCFDVNCDDPPVINDDAFIDYNVPDRIQAFYDQITYQSAFTLGNELMITMGSDFQYENAREWYENLDRLIEAVSADGRINIFYSTPEAYVAAKNAEQLQFTVKTDDFFPYADDDHSYWTGYFTSRPALKRYVRTSSALLQAARQVEVFLGELGAATLPFAKAVGIVQHHDAVAGTAKQHVAFDYAQRLHIAQTQVQGMMASGFSALTTNGFPGSVAPEFSFCELTNITICDVSTTVSPNSFQVLLYNPLARERLELVSIPVSLSNLLVLDSTGTVISSQILSVYNVSSHTPESVGQEIVFMAQVPAIGWRSYFIIASSSHPGGEELVYKSKHRHAGQRTKGERKREKKAKTFVSKMHEITAPSADTTISNDFLSLTFDGVTGGVKSYLDKVSGQTFPLAVDYAYYDSYASDGQKSGAYIFRPASEALPTPLITSGTIFLQTGPLVQEVTQIVNEWVNQTFRVVVGQPFVEITFTVGEIPWKDNVGKEVVLQYNSQIQSNGSWSADSNAREMVPRLRNHRESWNLSVTEPIAGNYVPVNAASYLTDGKVQLSVLVDRSQGVTSMQDGTLEFMIHRRTLQDDARGVGEPINETDWMSPYPDFTRQGRGLVITGSHFLFMGNQSGAASLWRPQLQRVYQPLISTFAPLTQPVPTYISSHVLESTWAGKELPVNVDLISLQSWAQWTGVNSSVLIRLAHQFAVDEDPYLSESMQVDLSTILSTPPTAIRQVSLTATANVQGNQPMKRMQWNTKEKESGNNVSSYDETRCCSVLQLSAVAHVCASLVCFFLSFAARCPCSGAHRWLHHHTECNGNSDLHSRILNSTSRLSLTPSRMLLRCTHSSHLLLVPLRPLCLASPCIRNRSPLSAESWTMRHREHHRPKRRVQSKQRAANLIYHSQHHVFDSLHRANMQQNVTACRWLHRQRDSCSKRVGASRAEVETADPPSSQSPSPSPCILPRLLQRLTALAFTSFCVPL